MDRACNGAGLQVSSGEMLGNSSTLGLANVQSYAAAYKF